MSDFWAGRRVLLAGHTGFKGSWLSHWLLRRGASVFGLALPPEGPRTLFDGLELAHRLDHCVQDIRDRDGVRERVAAVDPEIVFHLAAQPLVRRSFREPVETIDVNVLGTVHLLEALRSDAKARAVIVVTTDKVYENLERRAPYSEDDRLGGYDPYSASKAAAEILTASYRSSFFKGAPVRVATARAGNVIGGGDWAEDRILPDLARAFAADRPLIVRNPDSVRPWQHVLDPLHGYMVLAQALFEDRADVDDAFNFGPDPDAQRPVRDLVRTAQTVWPGEVTYQSEAGAPHEAGLLALDTQKASRILDWRPRWAFEESVNRTIAWYRRASAGQAPRALCDAEIAAFDEGTT